MPWESFIFPKKSMPFTTAQGGGQNIRISNDFLQFPMIPSINFRGIADSRKNSKRNSRFRRIILSCLSPFRSGIPWEPSIFLRKCNRFVAICYCPGGACNRRVSYDSHWFPVIPSRIPSLTFREFADARKKSKRSSSFGRMFLCESSLLGGIPWAPLFLLRKCNGILGNQ